MRRKDVNLTTIVLRCFITLQLLPIVLSCIYLLDGWMPISVTNRTGKADIVLSAHVIKTFKEPKFRTEAQTYTATVKLLEIYKGKKLLRNIPVNYYQPKVYNVTNFGDRKMCYADVIEGKNYILFLTTYKQRLSAKYDDIFGAATEYSEPNVQEVHNQIGSGLEKWTVWSSCSKSCDGGHQVRKRQCKDLNKACERDTIDKRLCNNFVCKNVHDLLSYLGVYKLPLGVSQVHNRPGAFHITGSAKLFTLFSDIYPDYLPQDFSILMTVNITQEYNGYLFALSDLMGNQKVALKILRQGEKCSVILEYNDFEGFPGEKAPRLDFKMAGTTWHQMAIALIGKHIELYVDCESVIKADFIRSDYSSISSNLMLSLGPYFARYGPSFQGDIELLVITDDSSAASQQCNTDYNDNERAIKDEENNEIDEHVFVESTTQKSETKQSTFKTIEPTPTTAIIAEWTEWSPCSRTCGRGVKTRTQYCGSNIISNCIHAGLDSEETRWCFLRSCSAICRPICQNGGTCALGDRCICPSGLTGPSCNIVTCNQGCLNGGRCSGPNMCTCTVGYSGIACENPICKPSCRNGGECLQPGYCACPYGYMPPSCEPICILPCRNGGKCTRHNQCKCLKGYSGKDCSKPICRRGCFNGGRCVSPNTCSCPRGYDGSRCHKPVCNPTCNNNGRCLYPGVCQCRRGYRGRRCEKSYCQRSCQNGGICAGNNSCACPEGFRGRWCHKQIKNKSCKTTCFNGGRCRKKRCRCKPGFIGARCEKRECLYEAYLMPYTQTYRKLFREEVETGCGPWKWQSCIQTRVQYITATRTLHRTAYRCVM